MAAAGLLIRDNLAWNHLWFVAYVLLMTFVLLPVFLWARTPRGRAVQARRRQGDGARQPALADGGAARAGDPAARPITRNVNYLVGDWYGIASAALLMLYGGFIFNTPEMLAVLNRQCWIAVAVGTVAFFALDLLVFHAPPGAHVRVLGLPVFAPLSAINMIGWLFAAVGLANRYLQSRPRFLVWSTEALYPFYMIHQTVTVITVYWLLRLACARAAGLAADGAVDLRRHRPDLRRGRAAVAVGAPAVRFEAAGAPVGGLARLDDRPITSPSGRLP